nr:YitT family protein [Enterococcus mediterraneensis]
MGKIRAQHEQMETLKKISVVLISGITSAVSLNFFLIPAKVLSAGMNGVAQIIVALGFRYFDIHLSTGLFILLLNIPIFILGFIKLGKSSTFWSFINVVCVSLVTMIIPQGEVTNNILMNSLMGGVLLGIGSGFSLKMGFTTGGMDILSLVLSKTTGKTVGKYMFMLNGIIIMVAGFIFSWESALYTIISIYCMSHVVDMIHTSHQKVTAMIITTKPDEVGKNISEHVFRGMTLLPSVGGYSGVPGKTIVMVITRYELYDLEQAVIEADENAFVNILPTQSIMGRFASEDDQRTFKATGKFPEMKIQKKSR